MKYSDGLSTLDQELFPGFREEDDRRRWRARKWAFAIILALVLALCYVPFWQTSGQKADGLAKKASAQGAAKTRAVEPATQTTWLGVVQTKITDTLAGSRVIPKGTLIPVEIESFQFRGVDQARILARTKSYVFPDHTAVIPPGSEVLGIAQRIGDKWEIRWSKVSVLSVGGHQAEIQAMNEIRGKTNLYGRLLLVKAN